MELHRGPGQYYGVQAMRHAAGTIARKLPYTQLGIGEFDKCTVYFLARYRKVTIWPRVQARSGLKVFSPVPEVMPCLATQATAFE